MGCGGTHVAEAGELVRVTITSIKNKKGRLRVSYCV
jgi:Ser-tRNA(Ala) deacylase AlaX